MALTMLLETQDFQKTVKGLCLFSTDEHLFHYRMESYKWGNATKVLFVWTQTTIRTRSLHFAFLCLETCSFDPFCLSLVGKLAPAQSRLLARRSLDGPEYSCPRFPRR